MSDLPGPEHPVPSSSLHPVTRRQLIRMLGAGRVGAAGLLAGCSSSSKPSSAPAKRGGTLTVAADADAYVLSGPSANVGQYPLNANIFEGLVRMDPDYGIVPVLATSWTLRPPNTWRFTLRRGVRFHNGQPFTAEAVKYTFDLIATTGGGGTPGFAKHA